MAYTNEQLGKALEDLTIAYNNFIEKAKEAAIAAMKDTVVAQIKQDAKEYIAAELATQKDALIQAIEHAKIALRNSAIEADNKLKQTLIEKKNELQALITIAENTLKEKTDEAAQNVNTAVVNAEEKLNTATKNIIAQAKRDLDGQGNAILATLRGEMTSLLAGIESRLMGRINDAENRLMSKNEEVRLDVWSAAGRITNKIDELRQIVNPDCIYIKFITKKYLDLNRHLFSIKIKSKHKFVTIKNHARVLLSNRYSDEETYCKLFSQDVILLNDYSYSHECKGIAIVYAAAIEEISLNLSQIEKLEAYVDNFQFLKTINKDFDVNVYATNCPNYKS